MYAIILFIYIGVIVNTNGIIDYKWIEFNDKFDCVAGISVKNRPVGVGVFVSTRTLITAANPLNNYIYKKNTENQIKIHTISNVYNNSKARDVESLAGNQALRKQSWVTIGYNEKSHTTIHDLLLITISENHKIKRRPTKLLLRSNYEARRPFPVDLPFANTSFVNGGGWVFAGFGYINDNHIEENIVLDISYLEESTITNCDEWMPREWGRFICLKNVEYTAGLASGSPLFNNRNMNMVIGIGSFAFKKGRESVLVFTDLRPYVDNLYGYLKDPPKKNKTFYLTRNLNIG